MSIIHVLEQLGANAALRQLSATELAAALTQSGTDATLLKSVLAGDATELAQLLQVPVYRCVVQVPEKDEDSKEPSEQEQEQEQEQEKPASVVALH